MAKPRRRSNGKNVRQKGHGKQRPRSFHRGRAEGERAAGTLGAVESAFDVAERARVEDEHRAGEHREAVREWDALLDGCSRVSGSCALAPLPDLLFV